MAERAPDHVLVDVDVERVDAVDKPATRRRWLLLKSEEADEEMVNAEELAKAAESVLEALAKEEGDGLPLSEQAVAALNALAKLLNFGAEFKSAKKPQENAPGYGYPEPQKKPAKKDAEPEPDPVQKAILDELRAMREALEKQAVAKSVAHPRSKQPQGEDRIEKAAPKKWGEGLFTDVIFGQ